MTRVLLVPLSDFPDDSFRCYHDHIQRHCETDLRLLPAAEAAGNGNVFLKKLGKTGSVMLSFQRKMDAISADFSSLSMHHRIYGIIGLVHLPSITEPPEELASRFEALHSQLPFVVPSRVFAFEPAAGEVIPESFIAIPADDLERNVAGLMRDFVVSVVGAIDEAAFDTQQRPTVPSPCGIEDPVTGSKSTGKSKMRVGGRIQKLLADLHLMTGSYSEAVTSYASASEDAKSAGDVLWNAAAQEGFNVALCLQNEALAAAQDGSRAEVYRVLVEKLQPLGPFYEKAGVPMLSVELQLSVSRIRQFVQQRHQATMLLTETWKTCGLLGFDDKLVAASRILRRLVELGCMRKYALFLGMLAQTLKQSQQPEFALMALSKTLPIYNLVSAQTFSKTTGWPAIQSSILKEMVKLSESHSNRLLYFFYGWMYLAYSNNWRDSDDQMHIIESLKRRAVKDMFSLSTYASEDTVFCGLPIFSRLMLARGNNGLYSSRPSDRDLADAGPFIYSPLRKTNESAIKPDDSLVAREPAVFTVSLSNPFVFPISLRNICLLTDAPPASCLSEQVSVTIPPLTRNKLVSIHLLPQHAGMLRVRGCCITFMNIEIQFIVDKMGSLIVGLAPEEDQIGMLLPIVDSQPFLKPIQSEMIDGCVQVYEGESMIRTLRFENLGDRQIASFAVSFVAEADGDANRFIDADYEVNEILFGSPADAIQVCEREIASILPISAFDPATPDASQFELPLQIHGVSQSGTFHMEIAYAGVGAQDGSKQLWRKLTVPIRITVEPIMRISDYAFFPYLHVEQTAAAIGPASDIQIPDSSEASEEEWCVGSCMIENPGHYPIRLDVRVVSCKTVAYWISPHSGRRIFFPMRRLSAAEATTAALPISEKQAAAMRKLKKSDLIDFVDETFTGFVYDHRQYWMKRHVLQSVSINWELFGDGPGRRTGLASLSQCEVLDAFFDTIIRHDSIVSATCLVLPSLRGTIEATLGQEIPVTFMLHPAHVEERDYLLRIFPVVELGDDEIDANVENALLYSGTLEVLLSAVSASTRGSCTVSFFPIVCAAFQLVYHVVEQPSGQVFWCTKSVHMHVPLK